MMVTLLTYSHYPTTIPYLLFLPFLTAGQAAEIAETGLLFPVHHSSLMSLLHSFAPPKTNCTPPVFHPLLVDFVHLITLSLSSYDTASYPL